MEESTKKTHNIQNTDLEEMLWLKGIAHEISKMAFPRIENLNKMLNTKGYDIIKQKINPL